MKLFKYIIVFCFFLLFSCKKEEVEKPTITPKLKQEPAILVDHKNTQR